MKKNIKKALREKILPLKMILLDNDGVLTDGSLLYGASGIEYVRFNVKDGLGLKLAQKAGLKVGIISGLDSKALKKRSDGLALDELHMKVADKKIIYEEIKIKHNLQDDEIAFIGDDIIDIPIMIRCGIPVAVADAHSAVKKIAVYVTDLPGGRGAVREFIDLVLMTQNHWKKVIRKYYE